MQGFQDSTLVERFGSVMRPEIETQQVLLLGISLIIASVFCLGLIHINYVL